MRGLRLCCEGVEYESNVEAEAKEKRIVPCKTESFQKPREATVIPAKRVCVKKRMCSCFIHCICPNFFKTKNNNTNPLNAAAHHGN